MSSVGIRANRSQGQRKSARHGSKSLLAPTLGIHTSELGESRVNVQQMHALASMYYGNASVQAAKAVLHSQLLAGGVQLERGGEPLKEVKYGETDENGKRKQGITKTFAAHLDEKWLPFARDVIDHFLMYGLCPVVFEEAGEQEEAQSQAIQKLKSEIGMRVSPESKRKREVNKPRVLVPHVPLLGTYDIAWRSAGRLGYTREYFLYSQAPGQSTQVDDASMVFVKTHPDSVGNVSSPLSSVYDLGSFVHSLVELAFQAETQRAVPHMVTQIRKKDSKVDELTAGGLFYDSESRAQASGQDSEESVAAARALELQAQLAKAINKVQHQGRGGGGTSSPAVTYGAPEVAPKLFTLPREQELAPHVQLPQPRGDLESLIRLAVEQFCAALGLPSSLVFEGRFSNNSSTQLQLLNSTVTQMAKAVSQVLTKVYNVLYEEEDDENSDSSDPPMLKLVTAPLSVAEEVERLFTSQLIDRETALPAALHSLGATTSEIEAAMQRGKDKDDKQCTCDDEDRAWQQTERKLSEKERSLNLEATKANTEKLKKEVKGMVKPSGGSDDPDDS